MKQGKKAKISNWLYDWKWYNLEAKDSLIVMANVMNGIDADTNRIS